MKVGRSDCRADARANLGDITPAVGWESPTAVKNCNAMLLLPATLALLILGTAPAAWAASFSGLGGINEVPNTATDTQLGGMNADGTELVGRASIAAGASAFVYSEPTRQLDGIAAEAPGGQVFSIAVGRVPGASSQIRHTTGFSVSAVGPRTWIETSNIGTGAANVVFVPTGGAAGIDQKPVGIGLNRRIPFTSSTGTFYFDAATSSFGSLPFDEVRAIDLAGTRIVAHSLSSTTGQTESFLWDETRGTLELGVLAGGDFSEPYSISASGRIVVGQSNSARSGSILEAYRWHPDLGMHALDPIVDGGLASRARATSDEDTVVGHYGPAGNRRAFIWAPHLGRRDLRNHLITQYDLDEELEGWTLTEATEISADGRIIAGNGINPFGNPEAWVVDLDGPDIAEVRLRPINPIGSPSDWELYLQCGDLPIGALFFGVVLPKNFQNGDFFDFADCSEQLGNDPLNGCGNSTEIGPTVSPSSFFSLPFITPPSNTHQRPDALYATLIGQPSPNGAALCRPGDDEVFLGPLTFATGRPELVRSTFFNLNGQESDGTVLPDDALAFVVERTDPKAAALQLQPSLDDVDGTRWSVTVESETKFGCLSFGITLTPDARNGQFADCNIATGGPFNERICSSGADLGPGIDPAKVVTVGPDTRLSSDFGLRGDTIYVFVNGQLTGPTTVPQMNVSGKPTELGVFSFTNSPPLGFGLVPTLAIDGIQNLDQASSGITDWCDSDGTNVVILSSTSGTAFGPVGGSDDDNDGVPTSVDVCPFVPDAVQKDAGTLERPGVGATVPDAIGDPCQCGDVNQTATVLQGDVDVLRSALADPNEAGQLVDAYKCNSIGPSLPGVINQSTGLPQDCNASDVFALLKAREGGGPLVQPGSNFVSCPDIFQPTP